MKSNVAYLGVTLIALILLPCSPLHAEVSVDTMRVAGTLSRPDSSAPVALVPIPAPVAMVADTPSLHWASYDRVTFEGLPLNRETKIRPWPFAVTASMYLGIIVGLHIYQTNSWWKADRRSFHFAEDWSQDLQIDKFGHFFAAQFHAYTVREAMLEDGFTDEAAHNWSSLLGALYSLYVEVEDGFATQWGFSPTDAYADIAGAGYFFAQRYVPLLQNFRLKWSYYPSQFLGHGSIPGQRRTVMDDYQGQSYWWSADVWNLLPPSAQSWYPKWLQLAVGYTARKYGPYLGGTPECAANPYGMQCVDLPDTRELYIGLDYSLANLIPKTNVPVIDWLIQYLDHFHFPAPALRLTPSVKGYLLFPLRLRIGNLNF